MHFGASEIACSTDLRKGEAAPEEDPPARDNLRLEHGVLL